MTKSAGPLGVFDQHCLELAIAEARWSLEAGNYPVGAILAIGDEIVGSGNNTGETSKKYSNYAETSLIIRHAKVLLHSALTSTKVITLYSTLEPCLMCLGVATLNKVNRIIYIQTDPHAGACGIDRASLGVRYQEAWPEIIHAAYSSEPKRMIIKYLRKQIAEGIRTEWSEKFLALLSPE
jgi:tRNA(Arg) A34 adenosine deaminase TadA